jgi:hypothetical protein
MDWRTYQRKVDKIEAKEKAFSLYLLRCIARF